MVALGARLLGLVDRDSVKLVFFMNVVRKVILSENFLLFLFGLARG